MQVQITETYKTTLATYISASCGKTNATVGIEQDGVSVCCNNAAHRTWRKFGKRFASISDAINNYRSAEMKAIIEAAVEFSQIPQQVVIH